MPKIIKDAAIIEDNWQLIAKSDSGEYSASDLPAGDLILPCKAFNELQADLNDRNVAVWLESDETPSEINNLENAEFVAINFPAFADGRGYSYAHKLRMQLNFDGEIRAVGDVLQDQLFYMLRVGFTSFAMREDQNLEQALERFKDFSMNYQGAVEQREPLFVRR